MKPNDTPGPESLKELVVQIRRALMGNDGRDWSQRVQDTDKYLEQIEAALEALPNNQGSPSAEAPDANPKPDSTGELEHDHNLRQTLFNWGDNNGYTFTEGETDDMYNEVIQPLIRQRDAKHEAALLKLKEDILSSSPFWPDYAELNREIAINTARFAALTLIDQAIEAIVKPNQKENTQ
jgi:hypothetical protein